MKKKMNYLIAPLMTIFMVGCTNVEDASITNGETNLQEVTTINTTAAESVVEVTSTQSKDELFKGYKLIEVDACDLSGHREANVVVDIGFVDREYWAFTNEYGQLVKVIADKIILQDDRTEPVTSSGRYCKDEAKVPGVERSDLDEGHVIADSMGGVSSAFNITAQNSSLNRHGDQAYMEDAIRKAGGATDFEAIITYPNTETQIPSHYKYTYTIKGNKIVDEFDNGNPDETNKSLGLTENKSIDSNNSNDDKDISSIDTNNDGQVTIKEAKSAGFKMPITKDHWLYQYMDDRDGDGYVGEQQISLVIFRMIQIFVAGHVLENV